MARATSSFPVPLSPVIRIVERLGAAWMIRSKTCFIFGLRPMMPAKFCACACRFCLSAVFSAIELPPFDGVAHDDQHFVVLERLGDVVEGAALHRGDRVLDRRERGNHDHRQVVVELSQLLEHRHAVHARHHHVDDHRVERDGLRQLDAFGAARRRTRTA